jgi:3-oxoacyl-[acyl-carrier protein] reductase
MTMDTTLEGRPAIVTGAARGIGKAIARRLGSAGARLLLNDLDAEELGRTVDKLVADGIDAVGFPGDVTRPEFGDLLVAEAVSRFGSLDIIVNNAGYTWDSLIAKMGDDQWQAMLDIHVTAPFRILRAAAPVFRAQAKADQEAEREVFRKVINISSASGLGGNVGQANYATAKSGINGLTKTLSKEWGRYKVNVNSVAFGLIRTRLTEPPTNAAGTISVAEKDIKVGVTDEFIESFEKTISLGRGATPEEAAGAVYLLCLPESNYITGEVLLCTGGIPL